MPSATPNPLQNGIGSAIPARKPRAAWTVGEPERVDVLLIDAKATASRLRPLAGRVLEDQQVCRRSDPQQDCAVALKQIVAQMPRTQQDGLYLKHRKRPVGVNTDSKRIRGGTQ